eukprot:CAMPEP_0182418768 /NCGR_PEP_ID=MMETSP1167-20130531/3148_1 /TAXON_ID=2988 /ORGANISM="Mallomonas Sp, Strain CCMP3275" /LENGTH=162 /DNA_ID=CAMNT_0024593147 /DNA_START=60 /DNA_END=548 /DNA_ORIENTATION=+
MTIYCGSEVFLSRVWRKINVTSCAPVVRINFFSSGSKSKSNIKGSRKGMDNSSAKSDHMEKFIELAEKAKKIKPDFSDKEKENHTAIAKEYQKQIRLRSNRIDKDIATKIWLQHEALRALPPALRAAAEVIDEEPPPSDRPWAVWQTPPLKDFDYRDLMSSK